MFWRVVKADMKQVIGKIGEFVKFCTWKMFTLKRDELNSSRRYAVMEMSRTYTQVFIPPSV